MIQKRIIPVLLLKNSGIIKTTKFSKETYLGDPLNAVKIFNEKEVDEISILDIYASREKREPNYNRINAIATECFMPMSYGGGISTLDNAKKVFDQGVEKIIINSNIYKPKLISSIVKVYGSSSVVVSLDLKKKIFGNYKAYTNGGKKMINKKYTEILNYLESEGAGELLVQSINNDGLMIGFDLDIIKNISSKIKIPLVICGGCGNLNHISEAFKLGASAVAAGSFFVFKGKHKAVLISYPERKKIENLIK